MRAGLLRLREASSGRCSRCCRCAHETLSTDLLIDELWRGRPLTAQYITRFAVLDTWRQGGNLQYAP
jgi:hypothetical protein